MRRGVRISGPAPSRRRRCRRPRRHRPRPENGAWSSPDSVLAAARATLGVEAAIDLALFGRMLAEVPTAHVDGAVSVVHLFSVDPLAVEDFLGRMCPQREWTAVPVLRERGSAECARRPWTDSLLRAGSESPIRRRWLRPPRRGYRRPPSPHWQRQGSYAHAWEPARGLIVGTVREVSTRMKAAVTLARPPRRTASDWARSHVRWARAECEAASG
ncbi:type I-E CRISPR-associated protein Cas7/Cse4/CasC [Rhodococcus triatomae]